MERGNWFIRSLLVWTLAVAAAVPAGAAPPIPVSGSYNVKLGPRTVEPLQSMGVGDVRIVNENNQATSTGTFTSTPDGFGFQVRAIVNFSTGDGIFEAIATFSGTVAGVPGTAVIGFLGSTTDFTIYEGDWVVLSGAGGLANLTGQGKFVQSLGAGSLVGLIRFD
jgi:hypothetical protein